MTDLANVSFAKFGRTPKGALIVLASDDLALPREAAVARDRGAGEAGGRGRRFQGQAAVHRWTFSRRRAPISTGWWCSARARRATLTGQDWQRLGGAAVGALGKKATAVTILLARPDNKPLSAHAAADFALGMKLRAYAFDNYRKKGGAGGSGEAEKAKPLDITLLVEDPAAARAAWRDREAVAGGVLLARDLVNEPPNILGPAEFAARAKGLTKLGVKVDVLTETEMKKLGMGALLGVAQGSSRPPRLVVMRWNGGKAKEAPVAFVGKGVVFDTGGISIKPAGGMEDMKGDMAGAAAVTGLMQALAARKAKVNAVGVIGIVENMPDGNAQRPGDIVTAMNGATIEIINTDAEGRLVLADAVAYTEDRFKPKFIIDLATLTGAIIVALGHHNAGMFASDDALADALTAAGKATGEQVWRMPLGERLRQDDGFEIRRREERRQPRCRLDHRGAFHQAVRHQDAVGAPRHRRHGLRLAADGNQPLVGLGLGRASPRPAGGRQLRELTAGPKRQ